MIVAIDGPGGVGKSTVARGVAGELGCEHLDTGATYRAATLAVMQAGVEMTDVEAVVAVVTNSAIDIADDRVLLNGADISDAIRESDVTSAVSTVAAIAEVRSTIVAIQQSWVADRNGRAVVEGRDIGTVVFPNAPVKVFLTARPEVRAARRAGDSEAGGRSVSEVAAALQKRDQVDSTRATSPLRSADDAVTIDTSDLSAEQVINAVLALVETAMLDDRYHAMVRDAQVDKDEKPIG